MQHTHPRNDDAVVTAVAGSAGGRGEEAAAAAGAGAGKARRKDGAPQERAADRHLGMQKGEVMDGFGHQESSGFRGNPRLGRSNARVASLETPTQSSSRTSAQLLTQKKMLTVCTQRSMAAEATACLSGVLSDRHLLEG